MTPHMEINGKIVEGTKHSSGDTESSEARVAHAYKVQNPHAIEVADELGPACDDKDVFGLQEG